MPLYREQLDAGECNHPEHDHSHDHAHGSYYFHASCHQEAPTWVYYEDGVLTVTCSECDNIVTRVFVASIANSHNAVELDFVTPTFGSGSNNFNL